MADLNPEDETYEQLKELLRKDGWKEQTGGEGYFNGSYGTNFMKNDSMIGISYDPDPDEEALDELFGSEDDMAPSVVKIHTPAEMDELELSVEKNDPSYYGEEDQDGITYE